MIWKILGLFVDTLIADNKFSLPNSGNLTQPIQMQLSKKQKNYFSIFFSILEFTLSFEHFQKNMTLIAYVFPKLRTPGDVVR